MVVEDFISYIGIQKRYSARTLELYREYINDFREFISPADDGEFIKELKSNAVRGFVATSLDSGLNSRTVNLKLSAISSFCNYLLKKGLIESNPVNKVPRPKTSKRLPHFYTEGAISDYLSSSIDDGDFFALRNRTIVLLLYSTGMRRAELASLCLSDWDRGRRVMRVRGKGDKEREIPVTRELESMLSRYLNEMTELYSDNTESRLFLTDTGQPLYLSFVNKVVKDELSKAPGFTGKRSPHMLRH